MGKIIRIELKDYDFEKLLGAKDDDFILFTHGQFYHPVKNNISEAESELISKMLESEE